MDTARADIAAMSFEEALRALEEVVRRLEGGDVPLAESIDLYERGEALRGACQRRIDAAQARIERIVAGPDGRAAATAPFDAPLSAPLDAPHNALGDSRPVDAG